MGIDNGSSGNTQTVDFGSPTILDNIDRKTILIWFLINANPPSSFQCVVSKGIDTGNGWTIDYVNTGGSFINRLNYVHNWSSAAGVWYIPNNAISTGVLHHVAITYDRTSTANNANFWLDGITQTVTKTGSPAGIVANDSAQNFILGNRNPGVFSTWWRYFSLCIYDRILSASEIADAYASKLAIPTWRGLVFAPQLHQRGEVGEGGTLTASHTIADAVSGALGTPSGSPLHKQDNYLRME